MEKSWNFHVKSWDWRNHAGFTPRCMAWLGSFASSQPRTPPKRSAAAADTAQCGGDAGASRVAATCDDLEFGRSLVLSCNLSSDSSTVQIVQVQIHPWPLAMAEESEKYHVVSPPLMFLCFLNHELIK